MKRSPIYLVCLVVLAAVAIPFPSARPLHAAEEVEINPRELRVKIREQLLKYTPLGSTTDQVSDFINHQLQHEGDRPAKVAPHPASGRSAKNSPNKGTQVIEVDLEDYFESPILLVLSIPVPLRSSLIAQWAFDKDGKLIEIFLDRKPL